MLRKPSFRITASLIVFVMLAASCSAGLFSREKEVKDEYLTKLFEPVMPYESIKAVKDSAGRKFIVIRTKEKITEKALNDYNWLLLSRGVSIFGTFYHGLFSWQKTVTDFAITITRKVAGEPDTIEISESIIRDPVKKEPVVAATAKGKEIRFAIEKDFGKKWKRIRLIPDKEPDASEPRIGRYPKSRLIDVQKFDGGHAVWIYVSKDSLKNITTNYKEKAKSVYTKISSDFDIHIGVETVNDPKAYAHAFPVFGIKTISQKIDIRGYGSKFANSTHIAIVRSSDPNLADYIEIRIEE